MLVIIYLPLSVRPHREYSQLLRSTISRNFIKARNRCLSMVSSELLPSAWEAKPWYCTPLYCKRSATFRCLYLDMSKLRTPFSSLLLFFLPLLVPLPIPSALPVCVCCCCSVIPSWLSPLFTGEDLYPVKSLHWTVPLWIEHKYLCIWFHSSM